MWGLPNRAAAWAFVWLSLLAALAAGVGAFFYWPAAFGVLFVLAALWYYLSIRWVDRYDRWR